MHEVNGSVEIFNQHVFRQRVSSALTTVRRILETTRSPILAIDHDDHSYEDKYALAESVTNSAIAASVNALDRIGLDNSKLYVLRSAAVDRNESVTLRFESKETCDFVKEMEIEIDANVPDRQYETYETTETGEVTKEATTTTTTKTTRSKVVNKVKEYHWSFGVEYSVYAYVGTDTDTDANTSTSNNNKDDESDRRIVLASRRASTSIVTTGSRSRPRPEVYFPPVKEVDLTWFLRQLGREEVGGDGNDENEEDEKDNDGSLRKKGSLCRFSIDRDSDSCHTPRRNNDVNEAHEFFQSFRHWADLVGYYFTHEIQVRLSMGPGGGGAVGRGQHPSVKLHDLSRVESMSESLFVPVLPLFESRGGGGEPVDETAERETPLLSSRDMEMFLNEQCRSIDAAIGDVVSTFPPSDGDEGLATSAEASLALIARHCSAICDLFCGGMDSIEGMLRSQLSAAIGKELRPSDLDEYLRFYFSKLFKEPYVPEPFMYAIRRPSHFPEGTLSIESDNNSGDEYDPSGHSPSSEPIVTTTRKVKDSSSSSPPSSPMLLPLSAATTIEFYGDRYLHAWVRHEFLDDYGYGSRGLGSGINLVARARQFSSFMLLIGTISGPDRFSPQNAIIVQNKDEVLIPLLLEQLPTPKEFKDAIESLSPEQKRFAKAFREMQLSTSVFGVLLVQLKPQLEAVLGLPDASLTKEIRLTQDLLSLFMQYQIPPDLLSYDGSDDDPSAEKVARVKEHVKSVKDMIESAKEEELEEERKKAEMGNKKKRQRHSFTEAEDDDIHEDGDGRDDERRRKVEPLRMRRMLGVPLAAKVGEFGEMESMRAASLRETAGRVLRQPLPTEQGESREGHDDVGSGGGATATTPSGGTAFDFTQVPKELDRNFERLDDAAALRPTKIKAGRRWTKRSHANLLSAMRTEYLEQDEQKMEKDRAFDLLDALSKSGALPLLYTELHVMVAATHRFDNSIVDTVVQDNVNPIEKIERSLLIVSSTIHGLPVADLVSAGSIETIGYHSPALLDFDQKEVDGSSDDFRTE